MNKAALSIGIVDDDLSVLKGLQRMLRALGMNVEIFSSAEQFLARTASDELNCLILDINLPGMSGVELRQRLVASGSTIPVIFVTAMDDGAIQRRMMSAGAYLQKPVSTQALLDAITAATTFSH